MADNMQISVGFVALTLVLAFLHYLVRLANRFWSRAFKLEPKDQMAEDKSRSVLTRDIRPSVKLFNECSESQCPLHSKPYVGVAILQLVDNAEAFNAFNQGGKVSGVIQIVVCEKCIEIACSLRGFSWTRKNYKKHPDWASSHILPHLTGLNSALLCMVKRRRTDRAWKWEECIDPKVQKLVSGLPLCEEPSAQAIANKYKPHLNGKVWSPGTIFIGDGIPEKQVKKATEDGTRFHAAGETPLVVKRPVLGKGLLVTDKYIYPSNGLDIALRDVDSVEKSQQPGSVNWGISVNGNQLRDFTPYCGPHELLDFLILMLRELVDVSGAKL